jgi:5-methylcytosine-specific restriction protein A
MPPTAWDFQNHLSAILNGARQSGKSYVDVESGNLHKRVGGVNSNRWIPVCCEVMRRMMRAGDSILKEPVDGQDATLLIRYVVQANGPAKRQKPN